MMSTVPATIVALAVLSAAGLAPAVALAGLRWLTIPLVPLAGSVIAALAATAMMAAGGTILGWFVALALATILAVGATWKRWPEHRPRRDGRHRSAPRDRWYRRIGGSGALAVLLACVWCLRGLATPTVGFDARALWLIRAGWFLQSHHQLLVKMRVPDVVVIQSAYPPLVSAVTAVAWQVTGNHSLRLAVVLVALLNTAALAVAALAVVDAGRQGSARLWADARHHEETGPGTGRARNPVGIGWAASTPTVVGTVAAVLLVFIAFGITEPFMTNGYADPIWSLAALGAVAYGLQLGAHPANRGVAVILVLVAGMSKNEGVITAVVLIVLIALRGLAHGSGATGPRRRWHPLLVGLGELAAVAAWPLVMRAIHARGATTTLSPPHLWAGRARGTFDGMVPYLHVIALAVPVAVVGGLALSRVRRRNGLANDWWAWAAVVGGVLVVAGAYVTGTGDIQPWLRSSVHRVTEFPALTGWWIVAMWSVVACGAAAAYALHGHPRPAAVGATADARVALAPIEPGPPVR